MIINNSKLVGALFYQAKEKQTLKELIFALIEQQILSERCEELLEQHDENETKYHLSVLFEGLGDMPVPPWGSVYLDKEKVIFGSSTVAYRVFLSHSDMMFESETREPEDQFGLMLMAYAYLLESGKQDAAKALLEQHLLTWAFVYLDRLAQYEEAPLFQLIALEVKEWLQGVVALQDLKPLQVKLYID